MQRFLSSYRTIAIILLNAVLLFILLEVVSAIILNTALREPTVSERLQNYKARQLGSDYYKAQDWSQAYWDEHIQVVDHLTYQPWRIWRTRPTEGEQINVTQDGLRVVPNTQCDDDALTIFTFGGSTMWGFGAPDWGTIPAYLQEQFNAADEAVCIVNYADVAYTSTQEVIQLLLAIQGGQIPDMVIFYDGSNDVTTANRTNLAGSHFHYDEISELIQGNFAFLSAGVTETEARSPLVEFLLNTNTAQFIQRIRTDETPPVRYGSPELAQAVLETYLANLETLTALAEHYDFELYAFIQPILLFTEGEVTFEEQRALWEMPNGLPDMFRIVYADLVSIADSNPNLTFLGDLLNEEEAPIWVDFNHVNPRGNVIIAQAIYDVISAE